MIYVYASSLQHIQDPKEYPELLTYIPQIRREKTMRYRMADARKQSLGAGMLLQEVMNLHSIKENDIYYGENGKPETKNICFNLSHSNEMAICAVSKLSVGCDIEKIKKEPKDIARNCFCKSEVEYLESFSGEKRVEEFFRLWTMKESFVKMTGEGMKLAFNRFEFLLEDCDNIQVQKDGVIQKCFIKEYEIPTFKMTVCAEEAEFVQEIQWIDLIASKMLHK